MAIRTIETYQQSLVIIIKMVDKAVTFVFVLCRSVSGRFFFISRFWSECCEFFFGYFTWLFEIIILCMELLTYWIRNGYLNNEIVGLLYSECY